MSAYLSLAYRLHKRNEGRVCLNIYHTLRIHVDGRVAALCHDEGADLNFMTTVKHYLSMTSRGYPYHRMY